MKSILQSEAAECGLASLAMVASFHGQHIGLSELRRRFPLSLKGAKLNHLIHIAQQLGFSTRPLRLVVRPEPIEAVAEVPDGPPLRFRWRRVLHDVAAIEGPERIAPAWWRREGGPTRDYFRAEDSEGRRFWLYREGLWGRETTRAKWFMHGVFG